MHPLSASTHDSIPQFHPPIGEAGDLPPAHMFRVALQPLGRAQPHAWTGWAGDAGDATRRAVEDARQRWKGYSFVICAVVQVGV